MSLVYRDKGTKYLRITKNFYTFAVEISKVAIKL